MSKQRLMLSLGLVGLLALPACARGTAETKVTERQEELPMEFTVKVSGHVQANVKQTVKGQFIMFRSNDRRAQSMQILGIQPVDPIMVGKMAIKPSVSVIPYEGDGEYRAYPASKKQPKIEGTDVGTAAAQATPKTSIGLEWWPAADFTTYPGQFMRLTKRCTVEVDDDGEKGHAKCDKLALQGVDTEDKVVNLDFKWQVKADKQKT
jgi:hypothetical protein